MESHKIPWFQSPPTRSNGCLNSHESIIYGWLSQDFPYHVPYLFQQKLQDFPPLPLQLRVHSEAPWRRSSPSQPPDNWAASVCKTVETPGSFPRKRSLTKTGGAITILKNMNQWGWDYPIYEMENKKWSKPPTSGSWPRSCLCGISWMNWESSLIFSMFLLPQKMGWNHQEQDAQLAARCRVNCGISKGFTDSPKKNRNNAFWRRFRY